MRPLNIVCLIRVLDRPPCILLLLPLDLELIDLDPVSSRLFSLQCLPMHGDRVFKDFLLFISDRFHLFRAGQHYLTGIIDFGKGSDTMVISGSDFGPDLVEGSQAGELGDIAHEHQTMPHQDDLVILPVAELGRLYE